MSGGKGERARVDLCARVRPLTDNEGSRMCLSISGDGSRIALEDPRHRESVKEYAFDKIYSSTVTTGEIFNDRLKNGIDLAVKCFVPCTIFAHGATGSGKTFTVEGSGGTDVGGNNKGIVQLCAERLFEVLPADKCVSISVFEIYNEKVRDLLVLSDLLPPQRNIVKSGIPSSTSAVSSTSMISEGFRDLKMLEDSAGQVTIMNLSDSSVDSAGDLVKRYKNAVALRAVGTTSINAQSSRSHCCLQITVRPNPAYATPGVTAAPVGGSKHGIGASTMGKRQKSTMSFHEPKKVEIYGKISIVDLAGLEDNRQTGNAGTTIKESSAINTSHFALARALWALKKGKTVHYRNSKLTRLFQNFLEPSIPLPSPPTIVMLITVSPALMRFQATYNTFSAIQLEPVASSNSTSNARISIIDEQDLRTTPSPMQTALSSEPAAMLTPITPFSTFKRPRETPSEDSENIQPNSVAELVSPGLGGNRSKVGRVIAKVRRTDHKRQIQGATAIDGPDAFPPVVMAAVEDAFDVIAGKIRALVDRDLLPTIKSTIEKHIKDLYSGTCTLCPSCGAPPPVPAALGFPMKHSIGDLSML